MKRKYLALYTTGNGSVDWLGEWDTKAEAQEQLDIKCAESNGTGDDDNIIEAGWMVETVGRNYANT